MSLHFSDQTLPVCTDARCRWCLDGFSPAEMHDVLGVTYRLCPAPGRCPSCSGLGLFPVDFLTPEDLAVYLYTCDLADIRCYVCDGVVDLVSITGLGV